MAKNSSLVLQNNIKNNSEELKDFLNDLNNWEKDIKIVDTQLAGQAKEGKTDVVPPVRCKNKLQTSVSEAPRKTSSSGESKRKKNEEGEKEKERIKAYDYAAWDKFDVDKALESSDEDETTTSTTKTTTTKLSKQERATALKEEGNKCYSSGQLDSAIAKYTQAMALDPSNPILPANRAMAYIKIEKYTAAEADCNKCIKLDPKYIKAYLRRGTSRIKLAKLEAAREDFQKVLGLEPWNKEAKKELEKLNKVLASEKKDKVPDKDKKETGRESSKKDTKPKGAAQDKEKVTHQDVSKTRKESSDVKESRGKGSESSNQGSKTRAKKIKIEEVGFVKEDESSGDPDVVTPIEKPPHLRSMKPLKRISVIDVPTCDAIGKLTTEKTEEQDVQNSSVKAKPKTSNVDKSQAAEKTTSISTIPLPPRTSHQFTQDWLRLSAHQTRAIEYLKTIPSSFFNNVDLDTDVLVDVLRALTSENVTPLEAASYLTALAKSNEFAVNIMFLDSKQKEVLYSLVTKCKEEEKYSREIKELEKLIP